MYRYIMQTRIKNYNLRFIEKIRINNIVSIQFNIEVESVNRVHTKYI